MAKASLSPEQHPKSTANIVNFDLAQLRTRYEHLTACCITRCRFATELVGGQPADIEGVRAFVRHHLKTFPFIPRPGMKEPETEDEAVARIMREEIGERDVPSETGELKEKMTYGVKILRRDAHGPYLGSWMCKACLKGAASRLKVFSEKRGTKGEMGDMALIEAHGISLRDPKHPERIYLIDPTNDQKPAATYFQQFSGRVATPSGSVSIQHDSECAAPGTRFEFIYRFGDDKLTSEDMADIFAVAMVIGLGSVKAQERGKFSIESLTFEESGKKK